MDVTPLFLGPSDSPVLSYLRKIEDKVYTCSEPVTPKSLPVQQTNFLVSYGYRHIIPDNVLELYPFAAINLHISLLPWNKGADPNFWSFVDDTPKGVTIHLIDSGLDTGNILIQKKLHLSDELTFAQSYTILTDEIISLFIEHWKDIRTKAIKPEKQKGQGSYHHSIDKAPYQKLLRNDWDTRIDTFLKRTRQKN